MNGFSPVNITKIAEIFFARACGARGKLTDISWSRKRQKTCTREPVRLAQSCFGLTNRWSHQHECVFQYRAPATQAFVRKYKFHKNLALFRQILPESLFSYWSKYLTYDTVKKKISPKLPNFSSMEGATMQAFTSTWNWCESAFCDCFQGDPLRLFYFHKNSQ